MPWARTTSKTMNVYISTMGCPKNIVDSENLAGLLESRGYAVVDTPEAADWMIVNTCGFIGDAKEESIARIFELAAVKAEAAEKGGAKRLLVSGCLSERYLKELYREMPEVDVFCGVNDYEVVPDLMRDYDADRERVAVKCEPGKAYPEFGTRKRMKESPWSAAWRRIRTNTGGTWDTARAWRRRTCPLFPPTGSSAEALRRKGKGRWIKCCPACCPPTGRRR